MIEYDRLPPRGFFTVSVDDVGGVCGQVQHDLPAAAAVLWLVIRMFSWQNPPEFVDIPDERFQALLGYSRQYVSKMLKVLVERGMVERRGRRSMRVTVKSLSEAERQQLFTSTTVYVNNHHEEEEDHVSSACDLLEDRAETSTTVDVGETVVATSTTDDVAPVDAVLKQVMALFEQEIGGTVTLMVAEEIRDLTAEHRDMAAWQAVFKASIGKDYRWAWIRKVMHSGGLKHEKPRNNTGNQRDRHNGGGAAQPNPSEQQRRDAEAAARLRQRGIGV